MSTGVGILGAGPVTQAIHLPTLARLPEAFTVRRVMDVDPAVAESVAGRVGAAWTTSTEELLADDAVEVVAVCSPHQFHAQQVIAACRAGKRAVLCEKPFAMDRAEAEAIAEVSAATGVPIVVGAMHTFDPGWVAAREHAAEVFAGAHTLRYSILLPPNPRFEDFATEVITRPAPQARDLHDPDVAAAAVRGGVMGLAIHDLPLVRAFCPDWTDLEVLSALVPDPGGYLLHLRVGDVSVQVHAATTQGWDPEWVLEAIGDDAALRLDFTPSYVHAGSATARITRGEEVTTFGPYRANGYEEEWRYLGELAAGRVEPLDVEVLIDDLVFALDVADRAAAAVRTPVLSALGTSS